MTSIDVMQAELVAQTTWRCQEKTQMVGSWKAKIYDMHNVQVGVSYLQLSSQIYVNFSRDKHGLEMWKNLIK